MTASGTRVVDGSYAVDGGGRRPPSRFRAVDGAGNETTASADVKVDTTPPTRRGQVRHRSSGADYTCTASATDAVSGVASLAWSVDGSVPVSIANGGTFTVAKGSVVVYATDNAGNGTGPRLRSRSPIAPLRRPAGEPTPRTRSEAVLLRKGGAPSARLVGQLAISSTPTSTTVDLRPLAIGKGSFQFVFKIKSGKKSKTFTKTQTVKTGYSTRITVGARRLQPTSVTLTVRKKSGKRWVTHASAAAKL